MIINNTAGTLPFMYTMLTAQRYWYEWVVKVVSTVPYSKNFTIYKGKHVNKWKTNNKTKMRETALRS
jgi:hypothetical protein